MFKTSVELVDELPTNIISEGLVKVVVFFLLSQPVVLILSWMIQLDEKPDVLLDLAQYECTSVHEHSLPSFYFVLFIAFFTC